MKLKIAIQKSGRLNEDSVRLLKECGIEISNGLNKFDPKRETFMWKLMANFWVDCR